MSSSLSICTAAGVDFLLRSLARLQGQVSRSTSPCCYRVIQYHIGLFGSGGGVLRLDHDEVDLGS